MQQFTEREGLGRICRQGGFQVRDCPGMVAALGPAQICPVDQGVGEFGIKRYRLVEMRQCFGSAL